MKKQDAVAFVVQQAEFSDDFAVWLHDNWHVYQEFERLSIAALKRGRYRLSAKFLFELIRWNTATSEAGQYKINNTSAASCARLFDHLNPDYAGAFEFRQRRVAA